MEDNQKLVYKDMPSPLGVSGLVTSDIGLAAILWEGEGYNRTKLSAPERDDQNPILLKTEQQLTEYFAKARTVLIFHLIFQVPNFREKYGKPYWTSLLVLLQLMASLPKY